MQTGYYNRMKHIENLKDKVVSISRTAPDWVPLDRRIESLMPSWYLLNAFKKGDINEMGYVDVFMATLDHLDARTVYDKIKKQFGEDCILCCWCGTEDFCHRHLVAEWFEANLGIKVREFGRVEYQKVNGRLVVDKPQGSLF